MEDLKSTTTPMNQKRKFNKDDGAGKIDESKYISFIDLHLKQLMHTWLFITLKRHEIFCNIWSTNISLKAKVFEFYFHWQK